MFIKVDQELRRADRAIAQRIAPLVDRPVVHCTVEKHENPGEPERCDAVFERIRAGDMGFEPADIGSAWGTTWGTTWFKVTGRIPRGTSSSSPSAPIELIADLGWSNAWVGGHIEALVYREDGTAIKALQPRNTWIPLVSPRGVADPGIREDGGFVLYIEAADNPLLNEHRKTDLGEKATGRTESQGLLRAMDVCVRDGELAALSMDIETVASLIRILTPDAPRYWKLAYALRDALNLYDQRDHASVAPARRRLAAVLASPAEPSALRHTAIGHAHIDSAWLWPVRETHRKVARTVSNVLALMDVYPDFRYAMSSAQQYAWLEQEHPDLFDRVRRRVKEGRFIPVGGMWVESDGMIPSGESLIRQISFGKRYFQERFGIEPKGIWLPDSFGYTGAFPQIARRAGYEWFLTQKISWNDTTTFPHHSFMWEGIDGSAILTHFPPSDTYGAEVTAKELDYSQRNFRDKGISDNAMMLFGYGDGGGGPTREMIERLHRFHDLEGVPPVEPGSPDGFFDTVRREFSSLDSRDVPRWKGELYLELHRATLTSQQDMKRGCRQEESLLRTAEYLCAAASVLNADYRYPHAQLHEIWRTLLLNQFHDILPGSAIAWVHREARADYQRDIPAIRAIAQRAADALAESSGAQSIRGARICQYRSDAALSWRACSASEPLSGRVAAHAVGNAGSCADDHSDAATTTGADAPCTIRHLDEGGFALCNGVVRCTVATDGTVTSLFDLRAGRESVPAGSAMGAYEVLRDEPSEWDAWDIQRDSLMENRTLGQATIVRADIDSRGAAVVHTSLHSPAADIETSITLLPTEAQLRFSCDVDWRGDEQFLKVDIPVALTAKTAHYECQYGTVERPVVKNTAADEAMFESCTHRFVYLAEQGYAVGIANASTYGSDAFPIHADRDSGRQAGTMMRLSLLSAPHYPDPHTDLGRHGFAWNVVVGGDPSALLESACTLNDPVMDSLPSIDPLVTLGSVTGTPVIDWIKLADDGSGDLIVRIYEAFGGHAGATLELCAALDGARVSETDVLERPEHDGSLPQALQATDSDDRRIELGPYQLATLRIHRN